MTARRRTPADKAADDALVQAEKQAAEKEAAQLQKAARSALVKAVRARTTTDAAVERAEDAVAGEISPARHGGASWPRIGAVLGLTRPGVAYNLYHKYDDSPQGHRAVRDIDASVLSRLEKAVKARTHAQETAEQAEKAVTQAVIAARQLPKPITWTDIAEVVGMLQPNAVAKYSALVKSAALRKRRHID